MEYLGSFMEMMGAFILYNAIFNENSKNMYKYSILSAISTVFFIKYRDISTLFIFSMILMLQIFSLSIIDKKAKNLVISEMLFSTILLCLIEFISIIPFYFITGEAKAFLMTKVFISLTLIIVFACIMKKIINKYKLEPENFIENNTTIVNITLNMFILITIFKVVNDSKSVEPQIIMEIILLCIISIIINIIFFQYRIDKSVKIQDIQVKNTYNPLLNEIIESIRANEHEYKNHLNIIYSIIQVSEDIDEIKQRAKKYIGELEDTSILNSVIRIENTVFKAIIYNKLIECQKFGIKLKYSINGSLDNIELNDTELTIILSNLLNNAIEATKQIDNKYIELNITNEEGFFEIEVKNNVDKFNKENLNGLFKKGVSTKGKGRGYGLYNVKKIIEKYKGEVFTNLEDEMLVIIVSI